MRAHGAARDGAHGERRIGRPERRRARLRDRDAAIFRHQRERVDVRRLALVGAHAERRIALQVLDRAIAFLVRDLHVLDGHVVLEIDEGLAFGTLRRRPAGHDRIAAVGGMFGRIDRPRLPEARMRGGGGAGVAALGNRGGQTEGAHHRTGAEVRGREAAGHETRGCLVILGLDAAMGREMHHG